ncbi:MAG: GNAT family N-acetyltransferase [Alphaproteobacteria bacterium]|nr:GNAT family N-acetyltransferase [Alphaproteobacteria bacterium]
MIIRLAQSPAEVQVAQRLRYHVFHEEFGARLAGDEGLDADRYDAVAQHLLVIEPANTDEGAPAFRLPDGNLVGTYRLITRAGADQAGGFYSAQEFDLAPLLVRHPGLRFLELGRSCVLKRARASAVVELLWQGIWDFVRAQKIDVMLGCASFEGLDIARHSEALGFLARHRPAPVEWQVRPKAERHHPLPNVASPGAEADKRLLHSLPPLIKGYLRLGCYFGEGCVLDPEFNSIDVLVVLPVAQINPRYFARFGAPATEKAAAAN